MQLKCPPWCKQLDLIMTSRRRNCSIGYMLCEELLFILFQLQITCWNLHSVKESGNSIPNVRWFINLPWPSCHLWNQYFLTFANLCIKMQDNFCIYILISKPRKSGWQISGNPVQINFVSLCSWYFFCNYHILRLL